MVNKYRFRVEPVVRPNGNCPSKEFYESLDVVVKSKFIAIFRAINKSRDGYLRDDKLRKLKGKHTDDLWEMRVQHNHVWYRIFCFRIGSTWMTTNGFQKHGNDTDPNEIRRGVALKKEYESQHGR